MVRAGDMRHEITIQQRSASLDSKTGEQLRTWSTFASRRAAVQRTTGTELVASAQKNGRVQTVFRLRYLAGVGPEMRIVFDSKVFEIVSAVDQAGRKEELIVTAQELVGVTP